MGEFSDRSDLDTWPNKVGRMSHQGMPAFAIPRNHLPEASQPGPKLKHPKLFVQKPYPELIAVPWTLEYLRHGSRWGLCFCPTLQSAMLSLKVQARTVKTIHGVLADLLNSKVSLLPQLIWHGGPVGTVFGRFSATNATAKAG